MKERISRTFCGILFNKEGDGLWRSADGKILLQRNRIGVRFEKWSVEENSSGEGDRGSGRTIQEALDNSGLVGKGIDVYEIPTDRWVMVLGFALQNNQQQASVVFVKGMWEFENVQLWMVIYISFAFGVLFWLVVSIFQVTQLKGEISRLNRRHQELHSELDSLRNLSLGEEEPGFDIKEDG